MVKSACSESFVRGCWPPIHHIIEAGFWPTDPRTRDGTLCPPPPAPHALTRPHNPIQSNKRTGTASGSQVGGGGQRASRSPTRPLTSRPVVCVRSSSSSSRAAATVGAADRRLDRTAIIDDSVWPCRTSSVWWWATARSVRPACSSPTRPTPSPGSTSPRSSTTTRPTSWSTVRGGPFHSIRL